MLFTEYDEAAHIKNEKKISYEEGLEEGREEKLRENIKAIMKSLNLSADAAMDALSVPKEEQAKYKSLV